MFLIVHCIFPNLHGVPHFEGVHVEAEHPNNDAGKKCVVYSLARNRPFASAHALTRSHVVRILLCLRLYTSPA